MTEPDQFHEINWVSIPNAPYIMKYVFCDTGYNIIVSNLAVLYNEKLDKTNIQERFCKLNPYAQMKSQVILENLKKSLEKCLSADSDHCIRCDTNKLVITLKFPAAHVLCSYDIEMDLMSGDKVLHYVIGPTILGAVLSQKKVWELQKRISSFDTTKSSTSSNISIPSQNVIDPEWLKGQNVPIETVLDSFLKIQNHFKDLFAENYEMHFQKKEKSKNTAAVQSTTYRKCKLLENVSDEPISVKFQEIEENISIKEEKTEHTDAPLSQSEKNVKKKKVFKI